MVTATSLGSSTIALNVRFLVVPLINRLLKEIFARLVTRREEQQQMLRELETVLLPDITLAVEKAKDSPKRYQLENWLERLKDAYYKTEEAIDLLVYYQLQRKIETQHHHYPVIVVRLKTGVSLKEHRIITSTKKQVTDFLEIVKECINYKDLFQDADAAHEDRETVSKFKVNEVYGRDGDRATILQKLNSTEHGVIAITGRPGVGKTTLVKYVYAYAQEQRHFDIFMWVYAPRKFKAGDVISKIIKVEESNCKEEIFGLLVGQKVQLTFNDNFPLEGLGLIINTMLRSKNCLLILDNFGCTEVDWEQWQNFTYCLSSWGSKSKILLTTPSTEAARQIRVAEENIYKLDQLEEGPFFELFMHHASDNNSNTLEDSLEALVVRRKALLGRKIAKKLKGDPKAAELVGAQLREKRGIEEWEQLSGKDWLGDEIMKSRIWSYQNLLHAALQRCFAFCGLFPKGHRFQGEMLIQLWMAEGFIKAEKYGERMEDIGKSYLRELVSRFFMDLHVDEQGEEYYVLHDLLHDLAERVFGDDCIRIEYNNDGEIPRTIRNKLRKKENIRHLSLQASMMSKVKNDICRQRDLRTLVILEADGTISRKELNEILKNSKKLRVLSLPSCGIKVLPISIGHLKHLRYLDISGCSLQRLPYSICKLYHLQVFALSSCKQIPWRFSDLISLRHFLTISETVSKISNVGRLTSIQSISKFHVKCINSHKLQQLENLTELRGQLWIKGLEKVTSKNEAVKAKMREKEHLETLMLEWAGKERDENKETEILEALCPHPLLRELQIINYHGKKLPKWLLNRDSGEYLNKLSLQGCPEVENISYIDQFFPNCKSCHLSKLDKLKQLPPFPPKLNSLSIDLPFLLSFVSTDDLRMAEERIGSTSEVVEQMRNYLKLPESFLPIGLLSNLQTSLLSITKRLKAETDISTSSSKCKYFLSEMDRIGHPENQSKDELMDMWVLGMELQLDIMFRTENEVPLVLPSSLTSLRILGGSITNHALSMSMQKLYFLSELYIDGILTITSLPPEEVLGELKHLQSFEIVDCYLLTSFGGIVALTSLKKLKLSGSYLDLQESDRSFLPSELEELQFENCVNIDVIIEHSYLPKLHTLKFCYCSVKKINLTHLSSLTRLSTIRCSPRFLLKGLRFLPNLFVLEVLECPTICCRFPLDICSSNQFSYADIDNLSLLRLLSAQTISELKVLDISWVQKRYIDNLIFEDLRSLMYLTFDSCQIISLPKRIKGLDKLRTLALLNCKKLRDLTVLPKNLEKLVIRDCPILERRYGKDGFMNKKIAHVPIILFRW